jgi:uncharacterized membrane protein YGL010W
MHTLTGKLSQYAAYHRDRRNIATHLVGIPMIVVALLTLLSRPSIDVAGWSLSAAGLLFLVTSLYYLKLDLRFGAAMTVLHGLALWGGTQLAAQATATWLTWGIGLFVLGWALQFVGHFWEGRKPAFVDDILGLIIGPLFVVAEVTFALGLRPEVKKDLLH